MGRILTREMNEVEELLKEIRSWSDEEVERLPKFYKEKAREYRELANSGEE